MPASRSGRAISSARGYWFDCTPTSADHAEIAVRASTSRGRFGRA